MMHDGQQSDRSVLAMKSANNDDGSSAELMERRERTKGNAMQPTTRRTQSRGSVSTGLDRVRQVARQRRKERFTALLHHVDLDRLRASYFALKRDAAPGVDGVTWDAYGSDLESRLVDLHSRVHRGAYRPQPSRRRLIPKPDGRERPLGIAALEDKVVQRAVAEVLTAIYEEDFLGFSYGFRPGRSQHDALDAVAFGIVRTKVNWILDADTLSFFDTVSHEWLMRFLEHRIGDQRLLRLVHKWLRAGVLEGGIVQVATKGSPQGAVISPLLSNIYLHYVFDLWAHRWRKRYAQGSVMIVRFADDIVVGFEHEHDAHVFLAQQQERFAKYSLQLHPDKTRLIRFGRFAALNRKERGLGKPETFTFLGFIHICAQTRHGSFQLRRKSRPDRMRGTLKVVKEQLLFRMHEPISKQGTWLGSVVRGYNAYHAVPNNGAAICTFRHRIKDLWRRTLGRRSQKSYVSWKYIARLADEWLPRARILHPWPDARFVVNHPRWEPSAGIPHARICAGGAR
jgi:RNA-directed DNA polymerase